MTPRMRSRMPISIGSNEVSSNKPDDSADVFLLSLSMVWSPSASHRRIACCISRRLHHPQFPPLTRQHLRVQHSGLCTALPTPGRGFDSLHPLQFLVVGAGARARLISVRKRRTAATAELDSLDDYRSCSGEQAGFISRPARLDPSMSDPVLRLRRTR